MRIFFYMLIVHFTLLLAESIRTEQVLLSVSGALWLVAVFFCLHELPGKKELA